MGHADFARLGVLRAGKDFAVRLKGEQQTRIQTGGSAVVLLDMVLETTKKKGCSEHEKRVGHNGAGYGAFHQCILAGAECRCCDNQFRQVSERCVEQLSTCGLRHCSNGTG
jgi:hypothetical protein